MKRKILLTIMMLFSFVSVVYAEEDNSSVKKIGYTDEIFMVRQICLN